jgi:hypothetical protein
MSLVSTVSGFRAHIAVGSQYIGSVNSYNNWFTKLFSRLFGLSMRVSIEGKERQLNVKSYRKLLVSLGHEKAMPSEFQSLREAVVADSLPDGRTIRENISVNKRTRLYEKLADAIFRGKEERAVKLIYQGADLERSYYQIGNHAISLDKEDDSWIDPDVAYKIKVVSGTPWIHAGQKKLDRVKKALVDAGAKTDVVGKGYTYKRVIHAINRSKSIGILPVVGIGLSGPFCGLGVGLKREATAVASVQRKDSQNISFGPN